MESRTVIEEALIKWNKWLSARNQYVYNFHVRWMKQFGYHMDKEEDVSNEDE